MAVGGPLIAHIWPAAHARHGTPLTHTPSSHTAPGHDLPAHGSTHTPSWHLLPSGQTTPCTRRRRRRAWHTLPGRAIDGGAARILAQPVGVAPEADRARELAVVALADAHALAAHEPGRAQAVALVDHAVAVVVEVVALLAAFVIACLQTMGAPTRHSVTPSAHTPGLVVARLAAALADHAVDPEHLVVEVAVVAEPGLSFAPSQSSNAR